jgi:acyl-coenzyme A thioesterase PaaI-like protein
MSALLTSPARALPGFGHCFGCGPLNAGGLKLPLVFDGDRVTCQVTLGKDYESHPGMIHGGIIATILDELMARACLQSRGMPAMTAGMRIRYAQVMRSGEAYVARAEITSAGDGLMRVQGTLESPTGSLVAIADATFFLWTAEQLASPKAGLPEETVRGLQKFLAENPPPPAAQNEVSP